MREKKFTEGPWFIEEHDRCTTTIEGVFYTVADDVMNCDANLISAAPELLEALEKLLYLCELEPLEDSYCEIDAAEAAIKKAYGE